MQDQVILPMSVGVRICVRGLRTRLGRCLVTVMGVALGTAFLMAVVGGVIVKEAISERVAEAQEVDRRASLLRGQIGRLAGKKLLVAAANPRQVEVAFVRELIHEHGAKVILLEPANWTVEGTTWASEIPSDVSAIIGLGDHRRLAGDVSAWTTNGPPVFSFEPVQSNAEGAGPTGGVFRHLSLALPPNEVSRADVQRKHTRIRMAWIIGAALLIMTICITNAMLMSVTERIREIGTMKCLGALSGFIVKLFLIESALIGICGSLVGAVAGVLFSVGGYAWLYGLVAVVTSLPYGRLSLAAVGIVAVGVALATIAGIYPARVASRMIPASALASHV